MENDSESDRVYLQKVLVTKEKDIELRMRDISNKFYQLQKEVFEDCSKDILSLDAKITEHNLNDKFELYWTFTTERMKDLAQIVSDIHDDKNYHRTKEQILGTPYEGLFGLDKQIKEFEFALDHCKNVILYGPPGCGKSEMIRGYAIKHDTYFEIIKHSDIVDAYWGESEKRITELFDRVEKNHGIVFFDEGDWLFEKRNAGSSSSFKNNLVSAVLAEMDGLKKNRDIKIVVSTNKIDLFDSAFLRYGRFHTKIEVPKPDYNARKQMIEYTLENVIKEGIIKKYAVDVEKFAKETDGYVAADIVGSCRQAAEKCQMDSIENLSEKIVYKTLDENKKFFEAKEETEEGYKKDVKAKIDGYL